MRLSNFMRRVELALKSRSRGRRLAEFVLNREKKLEALATRWAKKAKRAPEHLSQFIRELRCELVNRAAFHPLEARCYATTLQLAGGTDFLSTAIAAESPVVRKAVAIALGEAAALSDTPPERIRQDLRAMIRDPDHGVVIRAAEALEICWPRQALALGRILTANARSGDPLDRLIAARILLKRGVARGEMLGQLLEPIRTGGELHYRARMSLLHLDRWRLRLAAIRQITASETTQDRAFRALEDLFHQSRCPATRRLLVDAFPAFGRKGAEVIIQVLHCRGFELKIAALMALGRCGASAAVALPRLRMFRTFDRELQYLVRITIAKINELHEAVTDPGY